MSLALGCLGIRRRSLRGAGRRSPVSLRTDPYTPSGAYPIAQRSSRSYLVRRSLTRSPLCEVRKPPSCVRWSIACVGITVRDDATHLCVCVCHCPRIVVLLRHSLSHRMSCLSATPRSVWCVACRRSPESLIRRDAVRERVWPPCDRLQHLLVVV